MKNSKMLLFVVLAGIGTGLFVGLRSAETDSGAQEQENCKPCATEVLKKMNNARKSVNNLKELTQKYIEEVDLIGSINTKVSDLRIIESDLRKHFVDLNFQVENEPVRGHSRMALQLLNNKLNKEIENHKEKLNAVVEDLECADADIILKEFKEVQSNAEIVLYNMQNFIEKVQESGSGATISFNDYIQQIKGLGAVYSGVARAVSAVGSYSTAPVRYGWKKTRGAASGVSSGLRRLRGWFSKRSPFKTKETDIQRLRKKLESEGEKIKIQRLQKQLESGGEDY